ncbi:hypothetical protein F4810DRAFT_648170 [Camillea tinctor]|nr:hypothetical protein F4810DRAFT_648170 [Camillea tinctor]
MSTPLKTSQHETPILPSFGVFKTQGFTSQSQQGPQHQQHHQHQQSSTATLSDSGSNHNHTPQPQPQPQPQLHPQAPLKPDEAQEIHNVKQATHASDQSQLTSDNQPAKAQTPHLSRESSVSVINSPKPATNLSPSVGSNNSTTITTPTTAVTAADRHTRPESTSSSRPQINPAGSTNIKRAFTAKRTNRPERPLPSALPANKPAKDSSFKVPRDDPEPAKVVSDIVGVFTGLSTRYSTASQPAIGQSKAQERVIKNPNRTPLPTPHEKNLKRKHEEDQLGRASISRIQEYPRHHEKPTASPSQPFKGQNPDTEKSAAAVSRAMSAEQHIAKKVKSDNSISQPKARTPLPGTPKQTSIKLKPSATATVVWPSTRHVTNTGPNLGPTTNFRVHDASNSDDADDDATDDGDTDDNIPLQRLQSSSSQSNNNKKSPHLADAIDKASNPKPDSDQDQPPSISLEESQPRDKDSPTRNSAEPMDEWKYTVWMLPSGQTMMTGGALMPRYYQQHDDPDHPWVCPIRSCRYCFRTLWGLGGHFNRLHRGCDFNDNLDGTLSIVKTRSGLGVLRSKVVSKRPLDPNEPPMVEPQLPPMAAYKISKAAQARARAQARTQASHKETRSKDAPVPKPSQTPRELPTVSTALTVNEPTVTFEPHQLELWNFIHPLLKHTPKFPIPVFAHIPDVLTLPRVRDIEYNPLAPFPYQERKLQDITAMIVQATGVEPPQTCSRCKSGKGIFKGCYVVSPDAPLLARQGIKSCANCYYKLQYGQCDLRKWHNKTYAELRAPQPRVTELEAPSNPTKRELRHERRSERIVLKESRTAASFDPGEDVAYPGPEKRKEKHHLRSRDSTRQREVVLGENSTSHAVGTALDPAKMLELETWEVAPGRIRNEESRIIDNIAFSNSYLSQNQAVRISRDISFQVITIKPGTAHSFDPTMTKLRLCSVASGKVKVKVAGQEFDMGPNGMFKVSPGVTATAMNMLYIDVTIHVSVMPGDL